MGNRKAILLELNEVPFRVLDDYCATHPDSSIATIVRASRQYATETRDSVLSPWVTWPTVHRGVTDALHRLHHFGQDLAAADAQYPPVWSILAAHGVRTGVFGSLHSYPVPAVQKYFAYYVPDTFAPTSVAFPRWLSDFQEFNLVMTRESPRNVSASLHPRRAARLLTQALRLGLRADTLLGVVRQLIDEQISPWKRIRRRTYQGLLSFDVFMRLLRRYEPEFTTFFTNHVASAMHRYWAAAYPTDYKRLEFTQDWVRRYRGEITFTLDQLDPRLGRLLSFVKAHPEYLLLIASSMGQAACIGSPIRTQLYVTDVPRFMEALGVGREGWARRPAMAPMVSLYVDAEKVPKFRAALRQLTIHARPIPFSEKEGGFFSLEFGHQNLPAGVLAAVFQDREIAFADLGLTNMRIEDESASSGYHVKEGMLLVVDPKDTAAQVGRGAIDTTEIAPAILREFSVSIPEYMRGEVTLSRR